MTPRGRTLLQIATGPLLLFAITGCAGSRVVAPGDQAAIQFTCLQNSGELAATSYGDRDYQELAKSPLFVRRNRGDAVIVQAKGANEQIEQKRRPFEDEIVARLSRAVTGLKEGDHVTVQIAAERLSALPQEEQFVKIARIWKQAKEVRMSADRYRELARKEPRVGDDYTVFNAVPGRVEKVSGDEVLIHFSPVAAEVKLPFGKGTVTEHGGNYEIEVHAEKGTLIRTGGLAGRISDTDADFITIDYANPLGGEALNCQLQVELVVPGGDKGKTEISSPEQKATPAKNEDEQTLSCHGEGSGSAACGEAAQAAGEAAQAAGEAAQAAGVSAQLASDATIASAGDLALVDFTATLHDGTVVATTLPEVARDGSLKKVAGFPEQGEYRPQEVAVGKSDLFPGLGEALAGMKAGEQTEVHLAPEQAFGPRDLKKEARLPLTRSFPKEFRMGAEEYVKRFGGFPAVGKEVAFLPFLKSTVAAVTDRDVTLAFQAEDGKTLTESYGTLSISVGDEQITTTLNPKLGASFPLPQGEGTIVSADSDGFTVDGNSPLAGKEILLKVSLRSIAKGEHGADNTLQWADSYDSALARAKEEGKPTFLILYADWCGWCKKSFTEVLPDPRLTRLKDKFVWARVNSDKETRYKELYHQDGFPLMLVLNPDGSVKKRLDGFRDARKLSGELAGLL